MAYLQNAWYMAGWSHEITDAFLSRTLLDVPVLLFRPPQGGIVAMHDQCPHRFAPLSVGRLVDGKVRCGYHGLEFDLSGQCVGTCLSYAAPRSARVRTFPLHEQDGIVWIWMGDAPAAPLDHIVRFPFLQDEAMRQVQGSMLAQIDYRLLSDNLMDLTHAALLHPIFGGLTYQPKYKSWEEGDDVVSEYYTEMPQSLVVGKTPVMGVDTIRWRAPGVHKLLTKITPKDPTIKGAEFPAAHIITPETAKTTHYFWGAAIDRDSPMPTEQLRQSLQNAFDHEDKPMLELVQRRMGDRDLFEMQPLLLAVDASAVRVRRKLAALIEQEAAQRAAAS